MKALWEGALRHMSVPGGEERVKASRVVVELLTLGMFAIVDGVRRRRKVRGWTMGDEMV